MATNLLNVLGKLNKKRAVEQDLREDDMAAKENAADKPDKSERATKRKEKAAARAQKREGRVQRGAARKQKAAEKGRPTRLCSLATVEVKKGKDGFHVAVGGSGAGRKSFTIAPNDVSQVLRDLETAIEVIRGQQ